VATADSGLDRLSQRLETWDGVWWAVTTATTVGYGDLKPQTNGGRVIAMLVMIVGIGFVALLTAAAADRFLRSRRDEAKTDRRLAEIARRLARLRRAIDRRNALVAWATVSQLPRVELGAALALALLKPP
jgi:voltage-gated potassium channel Kch